MKLRFLHAPDRHGPSAIELAPITNKYSSNKKYTNIIYS